MRLSASTKIGLILIVPISITAIAYLTLLGYRTDYIGHHIAGAGGTMLLLTPLSLVNLRNKGRWVSAVTIISILIGVVTEATIFRLAIFDGVDFINQSLGAVIAGISQSQGEDRRSIAMAVLSVSVGLALVIGGFYFAFS